MTIYSAIGQFRALHFLLGYVLIVWIKAFKKASVCAVLFFKLFLRELFSAIMLNKATLMIQIVMS